MIFFNLILCVLCTALLVKQHRDGDTWLVALSSTGLLLNLTTVALELAKL